MIKEAHTIMVVDSSNTMLLYTSLLLKRFGYTVLTAKSGEDALRIMDDIRPSVVLSGIMLPKMDGVELLRAIKGSTRHAAIPVVMISSDADAKQKEDCLKLGCAAYLPKPVDPSQLYPTLQAIVESTPRKNIRLAISLKVIIGDNTPEGGEARTEYASVLSEGGLYVMTIRPRLKNTVVPLRLYIRDREIPAKAIVLYVNVLSDGPFDVPGMGVRFVELTDGDRDIIRRFIIEELTRDIQLN